MATETDVPLKGAKGRDGDNQGKLTGMALALLAVLFVAGNILVSFAFPAQRIDLTEDKLYTVSPATEKILQSLEEPVTLKFYFSTRLGTQLPNFDVYAERVLDLLREYRDLSDGMIKLEIYDPEPFSTMEDRAVSAGLQAVPLEGVEGNVFFGLVGTNLTDDQLVIPFIQAERESLLEFDISQMIHSLSDPISPKVGLMTWLSINSDVRMGQGGRPENIPPKMSVKALHDAFDLVDIPTDAQKIPEDIELLVIVHPRFVPDRTLFAIDQFVLGGGRVVLFVDPMSELQNLELGAQYAGTTASDLEKLLSTWGVTVPTDTVVGDRFAARRIGSPSGQGFVTYVPWLLLRGPNLDKDSPLTSQLDSLAVATAGRIEVAEGAAVALEPLVTSSPGSMLIPVDRIDAVRPKPEPLLADYQAGSERFVIAGFLRGEVPTSFPNGQPAVEEGDVAAPDSTFETVLTDSRGPIEVLVVADTDVLDDRFWTQMREFYGRRVSVPTAGNGDFVVNAVDALTGSSDLLGLRGRGSSYRPFEVIEQIKRDADRRFQSKEQELRKALEETEQKLKVLRERSVGAGAQNGAVPAALTEEERQQIATYQRQILKLRSDLREVQRSLREEVEQLETKVLFANIVAMPLVVAFAAILIAAWRAMRRRRRVMVVDG
jgi:ABC-type uncharacterized transport system involved in gliding motility auxiliary subunit